MLSAAAPHQRLVGRAMRPACHTNARAPILSCAAAGCALLSFECCYPLGASIRPDQQRPRAVGCASYATAATNKCASLHRFFTCAKLKRLELAAYKALANRSRQDPIRQMSSLDPDDAWDNGQLRTRVSICFQFQQRRPALRDDKTRGACQSLANPGLGAAPRDHGNQ